MPNEHYGFQNFNLVRRIARELLVNGYRGYEEFIDLPGDTNSTYNDRFEKVYTALDTCMNWPNRGRKSMWSDKMRIAENPLYALFKSRSMTGKSQYALHFALLDLLSNGGWHKLADIHRQLTGDNAGVSSDANENDLRSLIKHHIGEGHIRVSREGKYSLPTGIKEQLLETSQWNSFQPFLRVLSGRKKLTEAELIAALRDDAYTHQYYGLISIGQKNQISQRIDGFYLPEPMRLIHKDGRNGYSMSKTSLVEMIDRFPFLSDAIAFYSEYSPLGIIGSFLMSEYQIWNECFLFKNQYISQALDSIVLYDILNAIDRKIPLICYVEQYSEYVPQKIIIYPICVLSGTTDGRQYVYAYDPNEKRYTSIRLDWIYGVVLNTSMGHIRQAIIEAGLDKLDSSWGPVTDDYPYPVTMRILCAQDYVFQNVTREKRIGKVTRLNHDTLQFDADVYRPRDLIPWALTYLGKLQSVSVNTNAQGKSDARSSKMLNRMRTHIKDLYRMYHGLEREPFYKETAPYHPVPKTILDYLENMQGESPIFQTIYSKYLLCIKEILAQAQSPLSVRQLQKIIDDAKKRYNISPLDREISFDKLFEDSDWGMIQRYNTHQLLIGRQKNPLDAEKCCSFLIRKGTVPPLPMTEIQIRWLLSILDDDKIGLFLGLNENEEIREFLSGTGYDDAEPLYDASDIIYYDRYSDGDNVSDPLFKAVFRTLVKAIRENVKEVLIEYRSQKEIRREHPGFEYYIKPLRIEYSKQTDQFQLIGKISRKPPKDASLIERSDTGAFCIRLSNIGKAEIISDDRDTEKTEYVEPECNEPIVLRVLNIYGALERFSITFSPYKKMTEFEGQRQYECSDGKVYGVDSCLITLYYSKRDEKEVMNKLRSFGRAVEIISPDWIRQDFINRVDKQYQIFVESGFMKPITTH